MFTVIIVVIVVSLSLFLAYFLRRKKSVIIPEVVTESTQTVGKTHLKCGCLKIKCEDQANRGHCIKEGGGHNKSKRQLQRTRPDIAAMVRSNLTY